MKIQISKEGEGFVADPIEKPGSPMVGRGVSIEDALGNFLINHQNELGLELVLHPSAQPAELKRREDALAQR